MSMLPQSKGLPWIFLTLSCVSIVTLPVLFFTVTRPAQYTYSLIAGDQGSLYAFDGVNLQRISVPTTENLTDVEWRHDGAYALITGTGGTLLKYDGSTVERVAAGLGANITLKAVSWKPNDSEALIVGSNRTLDTPYSTSPTSHGIIFSYDGERLTRLENSKFLGYDSVDWNPSGTYALLAGYSTEGFFHGFAAKFDGVQLNPITLSNNNSLNTVAWQPSRDFALFGGDASNQILNATLFNYDGKSENMTLQDTAISTRQGCCFTNDAHTIRNIFFSFDGRGMIVGNKGLTIIINQQGTMNRIRSYTALNGTIIDLHHLGDLYSARWVPGKNAAYAVGTNSTIVKISETTVVEISQATTHATFRSISFTMRNGQLHEGGYTYAALETTTPITLLAQSFQSLTGFWASHSQSVLLIIIVGILMIVLIDGLLSSSKVAYEEHRPRLD